MWFTTLPDYPGPPLVFHRLCLPDPKDLPPLVQTATLDLQEACGVCAGTVAEYYATHAGGGLTAMLARVVFAANATEPSVQAACYLDLCNTVRVVELGLDRVRVARTKRGQSPLMMDLFVGLDRLAALVRLAQLDGAVDDVVGPESAAALHHSMIAIGRMK